MVSPESYDEGRVTFVCLAARDSATKVLHERKIIRNLSLWTPQKNRPTREDAVPASAPRFRFVSPVSILRFPSQNAATHLYSIRRVAACESRARSSLDS